MLTRCQSSTCKRGLASDKVHLASKNFMNDSASVLDAASQQAEQFSVLTLDTETLKQVYMLSSDDTAKSE